MFSLLKSEIPNPKSAIQYQVSTIEILMHNHTPGIDLNLQQTGLFAGGKNFFPQRPQSVNIFDLPQGPDTSTATGTRKAGTATILQGTFR
jgi:hypothetical protein